MKKITVYSLPTCEHCQHLKAYLKEKNLPYTDLDVTNDAKNQQAMIKVSGQPGVPVIVIDEGKKRDVVIGFNQPKLDELLT